MIVWSLPSMGALNGNEMVCMAGYSYGCLRVE